MFSGFRYWYRYYFVRKKAPLSYIWWSDILHRRSSSVGLYQVSLAWKDGPDAGISLSMGAPSDNFIELVVYDSSDKIIETVRIPLNYRSMKGVMAGFDKASAISRQAIRAENAAQPKERSHD